MDNITIEQKNQIDNLISFFNMKANVRYRFGSVKNITAVKSALDAAEGDAGAVRAFLKEEIANKNFDLVLACNNFCYAKKFAPAAKVQEAPAPAPVQQNPDNLTASMNFLGQVVMDLLAKTKMDDIKASVGAALREDVKNFIMEQYGPISRKVELQLGERKVEFDNVVHSKFDTVLKFVMADEPVFLTGPAGSGKNVLCQQVAKAMGLEFYFSNAVTQEYKITGFTDAMGVYHESQFYKAFKNGGLFMLDEMDASIPEVLIILNAAIANRYFDFPAPIGYVKANPNFRVIAAGNTFGSGADYDYVGRNQLDAASLNRFAMVRIDYDEKIEENCANGDKDLLKFCRKFRNATKTAGIRTVVSYRDISRMAKLASAMDKVELLDACLIKALEVDDLNAIRDKVNGCGEYSAAFEKLVERRKAGV